MERNSENAFACLVSRYYVDNILFYTPRTRLVEFPLAQSLARLVI